VISVDTRRAVARRTAVAACGLVIAGVLAGCSAGQISQTATQEPAVNGSLATFNGVALRNIHIQAVETGDALEPGQDVALMFIASNESPDKDDRLVSITTDIGDVTLTGATELPAGGVLVVGAPDGVTELSNVETADASEASVALSKPIRNGLTYDFTFTFAEAGEKTVAVPISAGNAPRQEQEEAH
jgi:copper(I)-binding protein